MLHLQFLASDYKSVLYRPFSGALDSLFSSIDAVNSDLVTSSDQCFYNVAVSVIDFMMLSSLRWYFPLQAGCAIAFRLFTYACAYANVQIQRSCKMSFKTRFGQSITQLGLFFGL